MLEWRHVPVGGAGLVREVRAANHDLEQVSLNSCHGGSSLVSNAQLHSWRVYNSSTIHYLFTLIIEVESGVG